jgi:hypothetical protein
MLFDKVKTEHGENKKNKLNINTHLNNFFYNPNKKMDKKNQKYEAKGKFQKYGFHPKVIDWLMDNYFECKYRDELYNFLAWHEKNIMDQVKEKIMMDMNRNQLKLLKNIRKM